MITAEMMNSFDLTTLDDLSSCVDTLQSHGLIRIKDFLSKEDLGSLYQEYTQLQNSLSQESMRKGHCITQQFVERSDERGSALQKHFPFLKMQELANLYFDQPHHFTEKADFILSTTETNSSEMQLHFGIIRKLRFIIYLTNAEQANGCFHCEVGSHRQTRALMRLDRKFQLIPTHQDTKRLAEKHCQMLEPITGGAGTLLVFDSDLFHRAGRVYQGNRLIVRSECVVALNKSIAFRALRYARFLYRQWGAAA